MGQLQTAFASPSELHTPDPAAAKLLRHIATAPAAGNSAEGQASPVETALAIARMVRQCTAQLRGTPSHLRCWLPPMTTQGQAPRLDSIASNMQSFCEPDYRCTLQGRRAA